MNVLAGNVSSSQNLTFTRYSYNLWFNGTKDAYGLPGGIDAKLVQTGPFIDYGIDYITLNLTQVYKNGVLLHDSYDEYYYAESSGDYYFRDDGYGLGMAGYIDALNTILNNYSFKTIFYPAGGNTLVGLVNSKENFEIRFEEYATGPEVATEYWIRVESYSNDPSFSIGPGKVFDIVDGFTLQWT